MAQSGNRPPRVASPRRVEAARRARPAPPAATGTTSPPPSGRAIAWRSGTSPVRSARPPRSGRALPRRPLDGQRRRRQPLKSKGGRARLAAWIGQRSPETLHRHDGGDLRHRVRGARDPGHRPRLGHREDFDQWQGVRHEARAGKRRQRDHSRVVVGLCRSRVHDHLVRALHGFDHGPQEPAPTDAATASR